MAINPIEILKDTIASVAHTITITSVDSLGGSEYKLNTANTLYLRTAKRVTIDAVDYKVTDFDINSYITVKALSGDVPVTASSFDISEPLFVWGNPQMVSSELVKRIKNKTITWPYMWVVEISNTQKTLDPAAAVKLTPSFNIFFLDSTDETNWTISDHYDQDIYPLNNYIEFFTSILESRRDLFATTLIDYTTTNHVNFGDYIVDQGNKEKILNDNVTGIQVQIDIPFIVDTCDDIEVLPNCLPVAISVDGVFSENVASGGSYNCVTTPGGSTFFLAVTGQENIDTTGDDGWQFQNGTYDNDILTDYYTLDNPNPDWPNHSKRITGDTGGYMDEATGNFFDKDNVATTKALAFPNDIMRDYAFRRRWYLFRSGSRDWATSMSVIGGETKGGETGWRLPSKAEYETISSHNTLSPTYVDSRLFNWSAFSMWCSSTNKLDSLQAHRLSAGTDTWSIQAKTISAGNSFIKNF